MTETDAVLFDDPINRATGSTAAEAVPQVFCGRDHQAGGVVFVERTFASQILAGFLEFDASRLDQALHRDFTL